LYFKCREDLNGIEFILNKFPEEKTVKLFAGMETEVKRSKVAAWNWIQVKEKETESVSAAHSLTCF
jgi:hypothetical protein